MTDVQIVLCTCPDLDRARQIGTLMVEKQLAACANLVPQIESIFRWEGEISKEDEVLVIFKTSAARYRDLERELRAAHPYDVPEILALPVVAGNEAYRKWVSAETADGTG